MSKWSEDQINGAIGLETSAGLSINIFGKEFYINITVDSKQDYKIGKMNYNGWLSSRLRYEHHIFTTEDFDDCGDEGEINECFYDIVREAVKEMIE